MSMTADRTGRRIVITMPGSISEVTMALPVANALRDEFPDAHVAWIARADARPLLRRHPSIDQVIELPADWKRKPRITKSIQSELRTVGAELAIDAHGSVASGLINWMTRAETRIGFAGRGTRTLNRWFNNSLVDVVFSHRTERALELLTPLGIHHPKVAYRLPISTSVRQWAERWRQNFGNQPVAMICPSGGEVESDSSRRMKLPGRGSERRSVLAMTRRKLRSRDSGHQGSVDETLPKRRWNPARFVATARYLSRNYGYRTVVTWNTFEERLFAEQVVGEASGCLSLAPATDVEHLAALLSTANLFIGVDSMPLHLAVAVGTKSIGLYSDTSPGSRGPYGQVALQRTATLAAPRHASAPSPVAVGVSVRDVCNAVDELHKQRRRAA